MTRLFENFADAALRWLWQTTLAAAGLAAIVLVIQATFGRRIGPRWTYALWMLVALRLVLPFAPESSLSLWNVFRAPEPAHSSPVPALRPSSATPHQHHTVLPLRRSINPSIIGATVWLSGVAGYLLLCLFQYGRLAAWVRRQPRLLDPSVLAALRSAQALVGSDRDVPMIRAPHTPVPAVLGVLRPRILLPPALDTWTHAELRFALAHELVHVRRRDNLLNWGLIIVQALHWFNPVVWFAFRRLRAEREALCDAIVLSCLHSAERRFYGEALIKAAECLSSKPFPRALVPILNHKHEIHRRIHMISLFKPTPRSVSMLAAIGIVTIACVTFTGAAQKPKKAAAPAAKAAPESDSRALGLRTLETELERMRAQINEREAALDHRRRELRIPSHIANGDGNQPGPHAETLRKLEGLRIDAQAELQSLSTLLDHLTGLPRAELRKAILTGVPDQHLSVLIDRLAQAEEKLASLQETYDTNHPEVKALRRTWEKVNQQFDERLDGVMAGLKARRVSAEVQVKRLREQVEEYAQRDVEAPSKYREYFEIKRELQNLYAIRDRLHLRLLEEKIDAALPRKH